MQFSIEPFPSLGTAVESKAMTAATHATWEYEVLTLLKVCFLSL